MVEPGDTTSGARPEHIVSTTSAPLRAQVGLVEQLGHEALVNCHIGETRVIVRLPASGVVHSPARTSADGARAAPPPLRRHESSPDRPVSVG
jgi:ABC-type sugar transport system ATPase subunit